MSNSAEPFMTEPSPTESLWDRIERIAKMLPLVLAGLYVLGFIIVALHLAAFGASSLELVRIQYLAAGFWFGLTVTVFEGITQLWHRRAHPGRDFFQKMPSFRKWNIILGVLMWVLILWVSPFVLPMRTPQVVRPTLTCLLVIDTAMRVRTLLRHSGPIFVSDLKTGFDKLKHALPDFLVSIAVTMGVFCIILFSTDVYPKIPFTFGGGQPRQVVFWLGSNNSDSFLERDSTSKYSVPYDLLLENENSFVVISPKNGQKVIEIDRKTVNAVIVLGEKRRHLP